MKILFILAILALMVYLVYRASKDETEIDLLVNDSKLESVPEAEEVSMPDSTFKKSTKIISAIVTLLVALLMATALLM